MTSKMIVVQRVKIINSATDTKIQLCEKKGSLRYASFYRCSHRARKKMYFNSGDTQDHVCVRANTHFDGGTVRNKKVAYDF